MTAADHIEVQDDGRGGIRMRRVVKLNNGFVAFGSFAVTKNEFASFLVDARDGEFNHLVCPHGICKQACPDTDCACDCVLHQRVERVS